MGLLKPICIATALAVGAPGLAAAQSAPETLDDQLSEGLGELERKADELSDAARKTIEDFIRIIGPMVSRFSLLIEDLPTYQTPEILPNGDIIIRRKREDPVLPGEIDEDGLTET